jgi:hypothetical protein
MGVVPVDAARAGVQSCERLRVANPQISPPDGRGQPAQKGVPVVRKRYVFLVALVVFLALTFGGVPSAARASTTVSVRFSAALHFWCVGSCATATYYFGRGIAHSDSPTFGRMTLSNTGTVLSVNSAGCDLQSENWALTSQDDKNTIYFTTTSSTYCPTADSNVFLETDTFTITGGSGLFSSATGTGMVMLRALAQSQIGRGTIDMNITY